MTVRELGQQLRSRKISCVELITQVLADIKQRDSFRTLITMTEDEALAEAAERDRELAAGKDRGPFHGIPIAVKDLFYTRGIRTTGGSLVFKEFIPDYDATVVERLRAAGAVSVGKSNLHEIAFGITSKNPHYGFVLNPLDPKRIAGGSSGGSAALIAGKFLPMALGTDTGGSIRVPAAYCGITGIKPTYGRVSRHGVLPLAFSLDHVGPLGSCVEDCALAMNALADGDFSLPHSAGLKGVRVGVPNNFFFERVDAEVSAAVRKSIAEMERLGAALVDVNVPDMDEANAAARVVQLSETAAIYVNHTNPKMFGEDVWALLEQGRMILGHEYVNGQRVRTLFRQHFDELWRKIDVLATPTTPITAPLQEQDSILIGDTEENVRMATTRLVRSINFLGEPALSMPCGKSSNGMPIGLQLISAPFTEGRLLQIAKTLEATHVSDG
ncbi:MAG TPA: amidase [Bryobacteraceae bacterium]|jgi:aspartyl-tRNA(Asn)/glutamyl-tRNA(Gln) amidotransferase subunit A